MLRAPDGATPKVGCWAARRATERLASMATVERKGERGETESVYVGVDSVRRRRNTAAALSDSARK